MQTTARFDLKIDAQEKDVIAKAAALMGTTMAAFVRVAAKEKAHERPASVFPSVISKPSPRPWTALSSRMPRWRKH